MEYIVIIVVYSLKKNCLEAKDMTSTLFLSLTKTGLVIFSAHHERDRSKSPSSIYVFYDLHLVTRKPLPLPAIQNAFRPFTSAVWLMVVTATAACTATAVAAASIDVKREGKDKRAWDYMVAPYCLLIRQGECEGVLAKLGYWFICWTLDS